MGCAGSKDSPIDLFPSDTSGSASIEVSVTVTDTQFMQQLNAQTPLLLVKFKLGEESWSVLRSPVQFWKLHWKLYLHASRSMVDRRKPEVRWFEFLIKDRKSVSEHECRQFRMYLIWVIENPKTRITDAFCEFCEISAVSFPNKGIFEGYAKKRRGGRRFMRRGCSGTLSSLSSACRARFKRCWFVLKDDYIFYTESRMNKRVCDVILFDSEFSVELISAKQGRGRALGSSTSLRDSHFLKMQNGYRILIISLDSHVRAMHWLHAMREAYAKSEWNGYHRFGSFAPPRDDCQVKFLVDGESYMTEIVTAISQANKEVYISGWWLVPHLALTRESSVMTLGKLLKEGAERGVKIYILLYKELSMALTLDSLHTRTLLQAIHDNIRVIIHPRQIGVRAVLAWSHHQKLVIVDNRVAFVGGLDLCLGRFDNESHRLFDGNNPQVFPGKDYCNPCIRELVNVRDLSKDEFDRNIEPRLPWHDISCLVRGTVVSDIARHFTQQWNYAKTDKHKGQPQFEFLTIPEPPREDLDEAGGSWDDSEDADFLVLESSDRPSSGFSSKGSKVQFLRSVSWWSIGLRTETSILRAYCELISAAKNFIYIENQFFITTSASTLPSGDVINSIGAAIAERLLRAEPSFRVYIVMPVMPAFENKKLFESSGYVTRVTLNLQLQSLVKGETSIVGRIQTALNCSPAHALHIFHSHVSVCGLRQIDLGPSHGTIFTEQIYVHSKAMIIDDYCAIIGSANINDRSMLGNRDSEIALVIEDESFAKSLRIKLWHEHFGLNSLDQDPNVDILIDPPSDACFRLWKDTARTNAEIYRKVFGVVPCDEVKTRSDFAARIELNSSKKASLNTQNANAMHLIAQITGRIVAFQFNFLENEQNWNDPMPASASFCPKEVFT